MTTKDTDQNTPGNDLSFISGIGPARRRWLRETFQINSAADLATASVDELYGRLKEEQIISRHKIETWIEQAKAMTRSENPKPKVEEQGWKPFASFVVEFQEEVATGKRQTKAHYVETDKTMTWAGIEQGALSDWIIEQLGSKAKPIQLQSQFNEKLEAILAKVARLTTAQEEKPIPNSQPVAPEVPKQDRLQEVIAKAQRLAASASQPRS